MPEGRGKGEFGGRNVACIAGPEQAMVSRERGVEASMQGKGSALPPLTWREMHSCPPASSKSVTKQRWSPPSPPAPDECEPSATSDPRVCSPHIEKDALDLDGKRSK